MWPVMAPCRSPFLVSCVSASSLHHAPCFVGLPFLIIVPIPHFPSRASHSCFSSLALSHNRSCKCIGSYPRYMAPDEEKMTRRSPLDFPIEWERPRPGRRPDIFPQFSPMKTPLPQPPPTDPPEEDEEEEEKKEEEKPEEEPDEQPPKET